MVIFGAGVILHAHKLNGCDVPISLQCCEVGAEMIFIKRRSIDTNDKERTTAAQR